MRSVSIILFFILLIMAFTVVSPASSEDTKLADQKSAVTILLTHISPSSLMNSLQLKSPWDQEAGEGSVWFRSSEAGHVPSGIDLLAAYEPDRSIIAYGTSEGIAELRGLISLLDIKPKKVSITAEFYKVEAGTSRLFPEEAESSRGAVGFVVPGTIDDIRAFLRESAVERVKSLTLSTNSNELASKTVGKEIPPGVIIADTLKVLPRVNGDGSITLSVSWHQGQYPPAPDDWLRINRRVSDGESIIWDLTDVVEDGQNRRLMMILTAKILE